MPLFRISFLLPFYETATHKCGSGYDKSFILILLISLFFDSPNKKTPDLQY